MRFPNTLDPRLRGDDSKKINNDHKSKQTVIPAQAGIQSVKLSLA